MAHHVNVGGTSNPTTDQHVTVDKHYEITPRLGAWGTLLIFLAYVVVQVVLGAVVGCVGGVMFTLGGGDLQDQADMATFTQMVMGPAGIAGMVFGGAVSLGLVCWRGSSLIWERHDDGIAMAWGTRRDQVLGCVLGVLVALSYLGVQSLLSTEEPQSDSVGPMTQLAMSTGMAWACWVMMAIVLAPPIEEFVFRGVLFSGVSRSWGRLPAIMISTALFVLLHITEIIHHWIAGCAIGMLALMALWVRIRARALAPAIWMHLAYNLVLVLVVAWM